MNTTYLYSQLKRYALTAAGVTLPLLSQSIILFQIGLSYLVLKKPLEREQVIDHFQLACTTPCFCLSQMKSCPACLLKSAQVP